MWGVACGVLGCGVWHVLCAAIIGVLHSLVLLLLLLLLALTYRYDVVWEIPCRSVRVAVPDLVARAVQVGNDRKRYEGAARTQHCIHQRAQDRVACIVRDNGIQVESAQLKMAA